MPAEFPSSSSPKPETCSRGSDGCEIKGRHDMCGTVQPKPEMLEKASEEALRHAAQLLWPELHWKAAKLTSGLFSQEELDRLHRIARVPDAAKVSHDAQLSAARAEATKAELPDVEIVAARVHEAWILSKQSVGIQSRRSETGEELMAPYQYLSEAAKDLDRNTVRAVYAAIRAPRQPEHETRAERLVRSFQTISPSSPTPSTSPPRSEYEGQCATHRVPMGHLTCDCGPCPVCVPEPPREEPSK